MHSSVVFEFSRTSNFFFHKQTKQWKLLMSREIFNTQQDNIYLHGNRIMSQDFSVYFCIFLYSTKNQFISIKHHFKLIWTYMKKGRSRWNFNVRKKKSNSHFLSIQNNNYMFLIIKYIYQVVVGWLVVGRREKKGR